MVHFVGAGPGAPDLITLRGARLLAAADVVVYAGSLVNPALLDACKPGCEIHDSSGMTLEEVLDVVIPAARAGKQVVRLHTGDPSLFGAIAEQMEALDAAGVDYEVVPGVSSMAGAAAALRAELTLPGVSQSVVVARAEGRTPVPDGQRVRDLAPGGSTMVLFLSAGLAQQAQEDLLAAGRAPEEPAAIVYKATWPDEAIYRCTVGTLAQTAAEAGVTGTALILVGEAIGDCATERHHVERSKLYDPAFAHAFRNATIVDAACKELAAKDNPVGALYRAPEAGGAEPNEGAARSAEEEAGFTDAACKELAAKDNPVGALYRAPEAAGRGSANHAARSANHASAPAARTAALVAFTREGAQLALRAAGVLAVEGWTCDVSAPARHASDLGVRSLDDLAAWTADAWHRADALVFVGAAGIAVRAVALHTRDKFTDPAVVALDEGARFAIPLLSGHVGGANDLARLLADALGVQPVVTTATDARGLFAVDEWAREQGLCLVERDVAKEVSAALLAGEPVGFASDVPVEGKLPIGLVACDSTEPSEHTPELGIYVTSTTATTTASPFPRTLHLLPRCAVVGVGCRRGTPLETLRAQIDQALATAGVDLRAVSTLTSIDVKADEPALARLAQERGWQTRFFTAEQLAAVPGNFAESDFVREQVGVGNVCERSVAAAGARLVAPKQAEGGVTVAVGIMPPTVRFPSE